MCLDHYFSILWSAGQRTVIEDAQLLDIGSYFCLFTNPAGNATKAFSLSVRGMNELKVMCIEALYSISIFSICCVLYRNFGWNLNACFACCNSLYNWNPEINSLTLNPVNLIILCKVAKINSTYIFVMFGVWYIFGVHRY